MNDLLNQIAKFGIVGVIAFVIDYTAMVALTEFLGFNPVLSATISFCISVVFNYIASMRYVFTRKEGMDSRREFLIFLLLSIAGLAINDMIMWLGVTLIAIDYRIVKIVATAIVMVWNFITRKLFLDAGKSA